MKKLIIFILFLTSMQIMQAQESDSTVVVDNPYIVGRWMEEERRNLINGTVENAYPYTYIFRNNMTFHRGEVSEGVILFNVTGKYKIDEDCIEISYYEYVGQGGVSFRKRTMMFDIRSITDSSAEVVVDELMGSSYLLKMKRLLAQ